MSFSLLVLSYILTHPTGWISGHLSYANIFHAFRQNHHIQISHRFYWRGSQVSSLSPCPAILPSSQHLCIDHILDSWLGHSWPKLSHAVGSGGLVLVTFLTHSSLLHLFFHVLTLRMIRIKFRFERGRKCFITSGLAYIISAVLLSITLFHVSLFPIFPSWKGKVIGREEYSHHNKIRTTSQYWQSYLLNSLLFLIFYYLIISVSCCLIKIINSQGQGLFHTPCILANIQCFSES